MTREHVARVALALWTLTLAVAPTGVFSRVTALLVSALPVAATSAPYRPGVVIVTDGGRILDGRSQLFNDKLFILWEYGGALRERDLAIAVLAKTVDPDVRALATLVRDGHQLGMDAMKLAAAELNLTLPEAPTDLERAAIEAAAALPSTELDKFFLRRQRAMHAWDVTVFDDYQAVAANESLKRYVAATRQPLREHAAHVVKLANRLGISGGLAELRAPVP